MNEALKTILNRRSIRAYKPEQIKDEEMQTILEAGRYAPSGMNSQPWHFSVVQNKDLLSRINSFVKEGILKSGNNVMAERARNEGFNVFYNAPTVIVVSGDAKTMTVQYDCTLALGNMFLAAESLGIGSCWIHAIGVALNTEYGKALLKEVGVPEGYSIYCSGAFGYKAGELPSPAPRKEGAVNIVK